MGFVVLGFNASGLKVFQCRGFRGAVLRGCREFIRLYGFGIQGLESGIQCTSTFRQIVAVT